MLLGLNLVSGRLLLVKIYDRSFHLYGYLIKLVNFVNKNTGIIIGVLSIAVITVAYYGISPLFKNNRIDDVAPASKGSLTDTANETTEVESVPIQESTEKENILDDTAEVTEEIERSASIVVPPEVESVPKLVFAAVVGTPLHPASGSARVITTENGDVIRYENFTTINGPDLFVYLAKDLEAKYFVNLGELKATEGNVNYDVPATVDVGDYKYVMVWCRQFGVLFNYAELH